MAPMSFQLTMRSGPTPGKIFPLSKGEMYVGRDMTSDIVINDAEISRKHARFVLQGNSYILEDLGSTNGSFVNGQRLMGPNALNPGDMIMFGENVGLVFEMAAYDPNATMIASGPPMMAPPPQYAPPPQPVQQYAPPPPQYVPPQQPMYAQQMPPGPVEPYYAQPPKKRGGCGRWFLAGCGCLVVILCLVVVGGVVAYMAFPNDVEAVICQEPLRPYTDQVLQALQQFVGAYSCP